MTTAAAERTTTAPAHGEVKITTALISVSDKGGVVEFARGLARHGVSLVSTGGTMRALSEVGLDVRSVEELTGSPEVMGGRVKTLHPRVHAGILHRRDHAGDVGALTTLGAVAIDLVCVNLYPFAQTVAKPDVTPAEAIENIDVGGPTMLRAAAKNATWVTVVSSPDDYDRVLADMDAHDGAVSAALREDLARRTFACTAAYDRAITRYLDAPAKARADRTVTGGDASGGFPDTVNLSYRLLSTLRYGENPHQPAAVYRLDDAPGPVLVDAEILGGKVLSFNNYYDLDYALRAAIDFEEPFAAVVKHANLCGAAVGATIAEAYQTAHDTDPLSAYGSVIGLNRIIDLPCAEALAATTFVECVIAPGYEPEALALLKKKKARRFLALPAIGARHAATFDWRPVSGGLLAQGRDEQQVASGDLNVVTKRAPSDDELRALLAARRICKHAKSNAIVLVQGTAAVGIGAGLTSRVDAVELAVKKAGERSRGAVLASDAFFPMRDGVDAAAAAGVTAIVQPGGSKRDDEAIAACDEAGIAMVFSSVRNFRH